VEWQTVESLGRGRRRLHFDLTLWPDETKFNHHTKGKDIPQICEKSYPPDLSSLTAVVANRKWTKALFVDSHQVFFYCDSSRTGVWGPERQTILLWDDQSKKKIITIYWALLESGRNFTQHWKATQQNQNPTSYTPKPAIVLMYALGFGPHWNNADLNPPATSKCTNIFYPWGQFDQSN